MFSGKSLTGICDTFRNALCFVNVANENGRKLPEQERVRVGQIQSPLVFAVRQNVKCDAPILELEGHSVDGSNCCDDVVGWIDNAGWVDQQREDLALE